MSRHRYHSPRRALAAEATRAAIFKSARRLFLAHGYASVTVADIAKEAAVAVPTVYTSAGGKSEILAALISVATQDPSVGETLARIAASDDPRAVVNLSAAGTRAVAERHWDLIWNLSRYTQSDPAAAAVLERGVEGYVAALAQVAARLAKLRGLRRGLSVERATDLLWFFLGQRAWLTLIGDRHWTFDRAEKWLAEVTRANLLAGPERSLIGS
jgi:AcrR family transcriptional regulator